MKKETEEALEGSIKKWERIVKSTRALDADNCPLCDLYYYKDCIGCPVHAKTGVRTCTGTPYAPWLDHQNNEHSFKNNHRALNCKECLRLARKELKFLISLREK